MSENRDGGREENELDLSKKVYNIKTIPQTKLYGRYILTTCKFISGFMP